MPAAARLGDQALCPACSHGCPKCPHSVQGNVVKASVVSLGNGFGLARLGDSGVHAGCCGPNTFIIMTACATSFEGGLPIARVGDMTQHCGGVGRLISGSANIVVGDGTVTKPQWDALVFKHGGNLAAACDECAVLYANQSLEKAIQSLMVEVGVAHKEDKPDINNPTRFTEDNPDEQVRAMDGKTGEPIPDLAYYIQTPDGLTYSGYTNAEGLCERVKTYQPEELTVWFGEDAEKRMRGDNE